MTLDREDIEAIAARLVQLLAQRTETTSLVGVVDVAKRLGVSETWVYRNAERLGARRVGRRLRFDLRDVERALPRKELNSARRADPAPLPPGVRLLLGRTTDR